MSTPDRAEQIARYRNMVQGDPDDDLAHFRLGQALMDDAQYAEAVKSFERTLELTPAFSRVFQHLGECLIKEGKKEKAVEVLTKGWLTANERGDRLPMEAMSKLLTSLGAPVPKAAAPRVEDDDGTPGTGFRCKRPGWMEGSSAAASARPSPMRSASGSTPTCAGCWNLWFKDLSIKAINDA